MEITIPWAPIKALAHLAPDEDIRGYIRGVWLDVAGPFVVVHATDGCALGAYRTDVATATGMKPVLIPKHVIKAAGNGFALTTVTVKLDDGGLASISNALGSSHQWKPEDWKPVDWRRVFPRGLNTGVSQQFDVRLLANFLKVRKALGKKDTKGGGVNVAHNGGHVGTPSEHAALVQLHDVPEFAGVVMCRLVDDKGSPFIERTPAWVRAVGRAVEPTAEELA